MAGQELVTVDRDLATITLTSVQMSDRRLDKSIRVSDTNINDSRLPLFEPEQQEDINSVIELHGLFVQQCKEAANVIKYNGFVIRTY